MQSSSVAVVFSAVIINGMQCSRLKLEYCNVMRPFIYDAIKKCLFQRINFPLVFFAAIYIQREIYYPCHRSSERRKSSPIHIVNTSRGKKTCHHLCCHYRRRRRWRRCCLLKQSSRCILSQPGSRECTPNRTKTLSTTSIQCAFVFSRWTWLSQWNYIFWI